MSQINFGICIFVKEIVTMSNMIGTYWTIATRVTHKVACFKIWIFQLNFMLTWILQLSVAPNDWSKLVSLINFR